MSPYRILITRINELVDSLSKTHEDNLLTVSLIEGEVNSTYAAVMEGGRYLDPIEFEILISGINDLHERISIMRRGDRVCDSIWSEDAAAELERCLQIRSI
jgi:hypothetical protein